MENLDSWPLDITGPAPQAHASNAEAIGEGQGVMPAVSAQSQPTSTKVLAKTNAEVQVSGFDAFESLEALSETIDRNSAYEATARAYEAPKRGGAMYPVLRAQGRIEGLRSHKDGIEIKIVVLRSDADAYAMLGLYQHKAVECAIFNPSDRNTVLRGEREDSW